MRKRPFQKATCFLIIIVIIIGLFIYRTSHYETTYSVWIGLHPNDMDSLEPYHTVVIDASYFSKEQIEILHKQGKTVYSYLNIGSLENFRPYYKEFQTITLGPYENWQEESWIDVSNQEWQDYLTQVLAKNLVEKGIDGFFLDNTDVWYFYPKENIYTGLIFILQQLKQEYQLPIIINGGDTFVSALIDSNKTNLINGVNQETVFTSIDFQNQSFGRQEKEQTEYLWGYLMKCKKAGLSVSLLEYGEDGLLEQEIKKKCKQAGFEYYISPSLELK